MKIEIEYLEESDNCDWENDRQNIIIPTILRTINRCKLETGSYPHKGDVFHIFIDDVYEIEILYIQYYINNKDEFTICFYLNDKEI